MSRFDPDRVDWDDHTFAGEVAIEICRILGWERQPSRDMPLYDTVTKKDTAYYPIDSHKVPQFEPMLEPWCALEAAEALAGKKRTVFSLVKDRRRAWRAGFKIGEQWLSGDHMNPCRAICMAIVCVGQHQPPRRHGGSPATSRPATDRGRSGQAS